MKQPSQTNLLLLVIAIALVAIALQPYLNPAPSYAQSASDRAFYVEPGVHMLRAPDGSTQVYGKVVTDLRTGRIWGFPTLSADPYPSNPMDSKPQTSHPFVLGKFAVDDMQK